MQGKVAIVTGGGTGIGRATVLMLVERGAHVVFAYSRSEREAAQTASDARAVALRASSDGSARAMRADVRSARDVDALVQSAVSEFGRLDLLVNNAAVSPPIASSELAALDDDDLWDTVLSVNVRGAFRCARAAAPHLRATHGAIVNIGSIGGVNGEGSSLPYVVSKAAVHGMTKALARALSPEVRVSCVAPGYVKTRWWDGREEVATRLRKRMLLDEPVTDRDVAALVCQLADQRGLTGQVLVLDAGQVA
ncbi:MAG TPA: SDR family oxidoreductase [Polyangiaceae bacterium]|nr:SDR family oxidoreductase [Polyangiaceae bacterium]